MFDFVKCATNEPVLFNIESKVDGDYHNRTRSPEDFVAAMGAIFVAQGEDVLDRITHQSFDVSIRPPRIIAETSVEIVDYLQTSVAIPPN
jgi:hypothetical protein